MIGADARLLNTWIRPPASWSMLNHSGPPPPLPGTTCAGPKPVPLNSRTLYASAPESSWVSSAKPEIPMNSSPGKCPTTW